MNHTLTEIRESSAETMELAQVLLSEIRGIKLISYEGPKNPWPFNWRGWEFLSKDNIDPSAKEKVFDWVEGICRREEIKGTFFFFMSAPPRLSYPSLWVKVDFHPDYTWIQDLWLMTKEDLYFVAVDETYCLSLSSEEWTYYAKRKTRNKSNEDPGYFSLASDTIDRIKRLDAEIALSSDLNGNAQLWRIADKQIIRFLEGYSDYTDSILVNNDQIVSRYKDDELRLWNIETGQTIQKTKRYREVGGIGKFILLDEKHVLTAFHQSPWGIALRNLQTGEIVKLFGLDFYAEDLVQIGKEHVLSACNEGLLQLWDISNERLIRDFEGHEGPVRSVIKMDSDTVLSCSEDKTLRWWNITTGESRQLLKLEYPLHSLAKMHDGCFTISGSTMPSPHSTYQLDWWDLQSLNCLASVSIFAPSYNVRGLELLDDNTLVVQFDDAVQVVNIVHRAQGGPSLNLIGKVRAEEQPS